MASTLPPLVQAVSGAIGSAAAGALTYPLEPVTTRLQLESNDRSKSKGLAGGIRVLHHIVRKYGIAALYDGLPVDIVAKLLSNFFYFYFYSWLRSLSMRHLLSAAMLKEGSPAKPSCPHKPRMTEELLLGFVAGVASRAISTPLNIITLQLQTERGDEEEGNQDVSTSTGAIGAVKQIYEEQGLVGFWRGFKTATILSLNPSITLTIYQFFRRMLTFLYRHPSSPLFKGVPSTKENPVNPQPREAFIGAAVSNSIAVVLLYPMMLAKTRLQHSSATSLTEALVDAYEGKYSTSRVKRENIRASASKRTSKPGVLGLYQGLEMQIVKGFLNQGVTFLVKGRVEQMIIAAYLQNLRRVK